MDLYDQDTDARWMDGDSRVMGTAYKYVAGSGEPERPPNPFGPPPASLASTAEPLALFLKFAAVVALAATAAAIFVWCVYVAGYVEGVEDVRAGTVEIWP